MKAYKRAENDASDVGLLFAIAKHQVGAQAKRATERRHDGCRGVEQRLAELLAQDGVADLGGLVDENVLRRPRSGLRNQRKRTVEKFRRFTMG